MNSLFVYYFIPCHYILPKLVIVVYYLYLLSRERIVDLLIWIQPNGLKLCSIYVVLNVELPKATIQQLIESI